MRDEGFHLFAGGVAERLDAAEIDGVGLDQVGIELMLANRLAESIANRTTAISVGRLRRQILRLRRCLVRFSEGANLFDRAYANPVGLAQGAIDRTGFRHAHLSAVDKERDVGGIGVTVAHKSGGALGWEDRCL